MKAILLAGAFVALAFPAYAFTAAPVPLVNSQIIALECSVVGEQPLDLRDPDPIYKMGIDMRTDVNGNPETYNIVHTARSGREYDRSKQYARASIWKTQNMEWFWQGYRRNQTMLGLLTWNQRNGWMYSERLFQRQQPEALVCDVGRLPRAGGPRMMAGRDELKRLLREGNPDMKTIVLAGAVVALALPAFAQNNYYGKANDYGSESFRALNQCYIKHADGEKGLTDCMNGFDFSFCRDCRIFGNAGPRCKDDGEARDHSWCWTQRPKADAMVTTTLLLVYYRGAHAVPAAAGTFNSRHECLLEKYKQERKHKAICVPADTDIPYYGD